MQYFWFVHPFSSACIIILCLYCCGNEFILLIQFFYTCCRWQHGVSGPVVRGHVMEGSRPDSGRFYRPSSVREQAVPLLRFPWILQIILYSSPELEAKVLFWSPVVHLLVCNFFYISTCLFLRKDKNSIVWNTSMSFKNLL